MYRVLIINLGATSTKMAFYYNEECRYEKTVRHSREDMSKAVTGKEQLDYRKNIVLSWLEEIGENMDYVNAVAMRGAKMPRPRHGGPYRVAGLYAQDLLMLYEPDTPLVHGARITLPLVLAVIDGRDIPIYVTDPPCVDELTEIARISGNPLYPRTVIFHALNQKEAVRRVAAEMGLTYSKCRFVAAHLGGGISVGAHDKGKVIDVNNCVQGEGPFSPERSGGVIASKIIEACYSGKYTKEEMMRQIQGEGGVKAYLGTADMREVEKRAESGEKEAELIWQAMAYQVGKEIGAACAVLSGDVDAIILTGGIAYNKAMTELIKARVNRFAPVKVYPGEFESEALVNGALRVLRGEEEEQIYI